MLAGGNWMKTSRVLARLANIVLLIFALLGVAIALGYWWLTSDFGPIRRARVERQQCAQGVSIPYEEKEQNRKLSRFFEFSGVSPISTADDVRLLYGTPEREKSHPDRLTYLNDAVEFGFDSGTVASVDLRNRFALLGGPGIDEPLSVYLGVSVASVLEEFGLPHEVHAGLFKYKFTGPEMVGVIEFQCFDFRECICTQISVRWRML